MFGGIEWETSEGIPWIGGCIADSLAVRRTRGTRDLGRVIAWRDHRDDEIVVRPDQVDRREVTVDELSAGD